MRRVCRAVLISVLAFVVPALAQGTDEAQKLDAEVIALYHAGKYAEAIPFVEKALALREKALGPDHPDLGLSLNNLAVLYNSQGRRADAERLYKRCLALIEKALGPDHPDVGTSLNNLAALYESQGLYAEAEPLYKRGLAISEKALGPDHSDVGTSLNNLAELYRAQGRYAEAEPLMKRAVSILEEALGPDHPSVGTSLNNLASLALGQNDLRAAAGAWRHATATLQRRVERGLGGASSGEAQRKNWYFTGLVKTTYRLAAHDRASMQRYASEMFEIAQWGRSSAAAGSLAQTAARSAKGSPALAAIVRERQDLVGGWQAKDKNLIAAKSEASQKRDAAAEKVLADRLSAIDARLASIDADLARDFPD